MHKFFQSLEKDHDEVKDLLQQLQETSDGAVKTREKLFLQLKKELVPHMKAEEQHFYPALAENRDFRKLALEAIEEHHVTELVLKELDSLGKDQQNWSAKLKVFKELVEHHIEEEEDDVFESAQQALDEEMLNRLMKSFEGEKEKIKEKIS